MPRRLCLFTLCLLGCLSSLACSETTADIDLDLFAEDGPLPTATLDNCDSPQLAHNALHSEYVRAALAAVASQIPGLDRSPLFTGSFLERCRTDVGSTRILNYACLGYTSGNLTLRPRATYPNANGDYDLELTNVSLSWGARFSGRIVLRVQGVANPDARERFLLSLAVRFDGGDSYATLGDSVLVVENSAQETSLWLYSEVDGGSLWVRDVALQDPTLLWNVRDMRNRWICESAVGDADLGQSRCSTPEDPSGTGILIF